MSQIVVPAAARSVITPVMQTTFQVGTYTSLTDTFAKVVDLNDHQSFWLVKVAMPQPQKVYARSSTIRAAGERITAWNYKNRHITLTIQLLYQSGTTALLTAVRSLLGAIENPPYRVAFAPPNASVLTYADVVAVSHTIPTDGKIILAKAISNITIDFECAPGFSGDRITLSNLVTNPGFEAPSGPGVQVFNDSFANANAYTVLGGSISGPSGNVLTINGASSVQFGSPAWGAIQQWTVRFQTPNGGATLNPIFALHWVDQNNYLGADISGLTGNLRLIHQVGGVQHILTQGGTLALTALTWYWIQITQFPAAPGTPPDVVVNLYNDAAGALGSAVTNGLAGPFATFDAVTALSGKSVIWSNNTNSMAIGGAFSNVHTLSLFGPGGWVSSGYNGSATGHSALAWEQSTANTYGGGAVTSFGAARVDLPPAGIVDAFWAHYVGGAPAGTTAIPIAAVGNVMRVSAYAKTSGLSATAKVEINLSEYDASGTFLRQTINDVAANTLTAWTPIALTVTTGAGCAYVGMGLRVFDSVAGASANGIVWFDNAQCWNQTTTGQTVMPYCELRFPQSPAQLLLTGLQGDMVAPAYLDVGVPIGAITMAEFQYTLGVRATPDGRGALIAGAQAGRLASSGVNYVLNSAVYGGYTINSAPSVSSYPVLGKAAGLLGAYHVFAAVYPNDNHYAYQSATLDLYELLSNDATATIYTVYNPVAAPWSPTAQQWYWYDAGAVYVPVSPALAREDQTLKWLMLQLGMNDSYGSPTNPPFYLGPVVLMPIDGGLVSALIFPNTSAVSNMWVWTYLDPPQLPVANALTSQGGWRNSIEATSAPNPSHATGGVNVSGPMDVRPLADSELLLDPTNSGGIDGSPIMQAAAVLSDVLAGLTYPIYHEMQYTPLYLYPRQS